MLRRDAGGRYQIHELLRQYANGKLDNSEIEALARVHCHYYCDFLAQRKAGLVEGAQVKNSLEVEEELDNIRTAWQYSIDHQQLNALKKAAAPYFYFCQMQSRYLEYADASGLAVAAFEEAKDLSRLAQVLVYRGWMLIRIGQFEQAAEELAHSNALFARLSLKPDYSMGSHPLAPLTILTVIQGDYARAAKLGEQLKLDMVGLFQSR